MIVTCSQFEVGSMSFSQWLMYGTYLNSDLTDLCYKPQYYVTEGRDTLLASGCAFTMIECWMYALLYTTVNTGHL